MPHRLLAAVALAALQRPGAGTARHRPRRHPRHGRVESLSCPIWGDGTRLDHLFPLDAVNACRDELKKRADLAQYTTAAAMDDVDEVRLPARYAGPDPTRHPRRRGEL